jgi:MFS family permease
MLAYPRVLAAAVLCYAALGAVLRIIPTRLHELGAGAVAIGFAVGAPALTGAFFRPAGGRIADRVGPRAVVVAGALGMAAGVAPAFVPTVAAQVASRLLVGAGEGLMMAAAVLWLLRLGGPERRGRALGHIGLANYGGLAIGPVLADVLGGGTHPTRVLVAAAILPPLGAATLTGLRAPAADDAGEDAEHDLRGIAKAVLRPGLGLTLVNFGYVTVLSFGTLAASERGVAGAALVVPVFALTVIIARTLGASIPDRVGAARTLAVAAPVAAVGLAAESLAATTVPTVAAVVVVAAGQALAVPALGVLALSRVAPARHGAAAGLFFSFFDAGVGLGGPLSGVLARASGAPGALAGAAFAVACAAPLALLWSGRKPLRPLVD